MAAIKIQCRARVWLTKQHLVVRKLEAKLRQLKRDKVQDLAAVEDWKMEEMKHIYEKYNSKRAKTIQDMKETESSFFDASREAHRLRQENKEFRATLEEMRTEGKDIFLANTSLERTIATIQKSIAIVQSALPKLQSDHEKLLGIVTIFEKKKQSYLVAEEEGKALYDLEVSLRNLYQMTGQEIVLMASKSRREPDPRLIPMIKKAAERDFKATEKKYQDTLRAIEKLKKENAKKYETRGSDNTKKPSNDKSKNRKQGSSDEDSSSSSDESSSDDDRGRFPVAKRKGFRSSSVTTNNSLDKIEEGTEEGEDEDEIDKRSGRAKTRDGTATRSRSKSRGQSKGRSKSKDSRKTKKSGDEKDNKSKREEKLHNSFNSSSSSKQSKSEKKSSKS